MTFPQQIVNSLPPDNEMVTGTVTSTAPLIVSVRGGTVLNPGTLGSYLPVAGDVVQLMRQGATWLILGNNATSTDATNTIAAYSDNSITAATTSATYVNVTGAFLSFTKRFANSRVRVDMDVSCFISAVANTRPMFGLDFINLSGSPNTRVNVVTMLINPLSTHTVLAAGNLFSSISAGQYTVQLLWQRAAGTGQLNIAATDDWLSFVVTEVA